MARNQTVSRPSSNLFALNRLRKDCYYEPVRVDFSSIQKPNNQFEAIIPYFNKDGHYFTPTFILPRDKITVEQNLKVEKNKFQARIHHSQNQTQEKTPEYNPTDNNYCQLCQEEFQDYWEHINAKYHKRQINSSKFNKDIIALCETMKRTHKAQNPCKTKTIQKKKTNPKKTIKTKTSKDQTSKNNEFLKGKESLQTLDNDLSENINSVDFQGERKKNLEQSLKITLQLGNHSTNLLSSNTFKQFWKNP